MANKRYLKKAVKATCGELAGECIIARDIMPGIDPAKMNEAIIQVADLQYTIVKAVSFSFDKGHKGFPDGKSYRKARADYFKKAYGKLRKEYEDGLEAVVATMNQALPSVKKADNE